MATWSTVSVATAMEWERLDANYFHPTDLAWLKGASEKGGLRLGELCDEVMAGKSPKYDENGEFLAVRSGDLSSSLIYPDCGVEFLRARRSRTLRPLEKYDILISSIGMGSIGRVGLVMEPSQLIAVAEVTILRRPVFSPFYVFAYLRTTEGQRQILREVTGATGQQHLLPTKVQGIVVPSPEGDIEDRVKRLALDAWSAEKRARDAYLEIRSVAEESLQTIRQGS